MAATSTPTATRTAPQPRPQGTGRHELKFDFPLAGTTVFREGDDLGFRPAGGEPLRVSDFFKTDASVEPPRLLFADLPAMTGDDLPALLAVDPASDESWQVLYTPQELPSGGIGDYSDGAGDLVSGIEVLDSLGTDYYSPKVLGGDAYDAPSPSSTSSLPAARGGGNNTRALDGSSSLSGKTIVRFSEDGLMATPQQAGNLALGQFPGATYALKDGGIGRYGLFRLNPDGSWTYSRTADISMMAEGKTYTEDFPIIINPPDGSSVEWLVEVDIVGDNNAPLLTAASFGVDDAVLASGTGIHGTITGSDVDEGDSAGAFRIGNAPTALLVEGGTSAPVDINDYGTLQVNADGSWSFVPRTPAQQERLLALAPGQQLVVTVDVTASDTHGAAGSTTLTITVTGTNQVPEFNAETLSAQIGEDALIAASGNLNGRITAHDPEDDAAGINLAHTPVNTQGLYGTFTLATDGNWTYVLKPGLDINFMAQGRSYVETFTVTVGDGDGAEVQRQFTLTIAGDNDAPVITGFSQSALDLGAVNGVVLAGQIWATDVDEDDSVGNYRVSGPVGASINGVTVDLADYGELALDADGSWRFVAQTPEQQANLRNLPVGDLLSLTLTVQAQDTHGALADKSMTIEVNGQNNAPVLDPGGLNAGILEDDLIAAGVLTGTLSATDADNDPLTYSLAGNSAGTYGTLTLSAGGDWTYVPSRDINFMVEGQAYTETFRIRVGDGRGGVDEQDLTITITGENDAPVVGAVSITPVDTELYNGTMFSGMIPVTDPDAGDTATITHGSISATRGGTSVDPADYGVFTLDAGGNWTFQAQTQAQKDNMLGLAEGETLVISVPVTATDTQGGTGTAELVITVAGTNQDPVFVGTGLNVTATEASLMADPVLTGQLEAGDPDTGDILIYGVRDGNGIYGSLGVNPDGTWTYTRTGDISFLPPGTEYTEHFIVTVTDGHGNVIEQTFSLTISGSNNAPILQDANAVGTDAALSGGLVLSGQISGMDPDAGDGISYGVGTISALRGGAAVNPADYGTLVLNADGTWTFEAVTQAQKGAMLGLSDGETLIVSAPVIGTDTHGATGAGTLAITITGTNQAPVFNAATLIASAGEDDVVPAGSISGQLAATDPDTGDTLIYSFKPGTGTGTYGSFSVDPDGSWTYTPTAGIHQLAEGETVTETFTAVVSDGHGGTAEQTFTLTLTGNNDAPVLQAAAATATDAAMHGGTILSGSIMGTDPEGDAITYGVGTATAAVNGVPVILSDYGTLTMNADGTWTFEAVTQAQKDAMLGLAEGETLVLSVPVTGTDTYGATGAGILAITITGTNQAPEFDAGTLSAQIGEDALIAASGTLGGTVTAGDPEGDAVTYTATTQQGLYGTFTLATDGTWTYILNSGVDINFMAQGRNYVETFTVAASDNHGAGSQQQFTLTIAGDNDVPVITGVSHGATNLDAADGVVLTGRVLATDADEGDSIVNYQIIGPVDASINGVTVDLAGYGELVLNADGSWGFEAQTQIQRDNLQSLPSGSALTVTAGVQVQDTHGASGNGTITIEVNGQNNAPAMDLNGLNVGILEDDLIAAGKLTGTVSGTDGDGDALTYSLAGNSAGIYGSLTLAAGGDWTYVPTRDINFMADGQAYTETFRIRVSDGRGGVDEQDLTITITGENDAPVLQNATATTTDAALGGGTALSGSITGTDPEGDAVTFGADAATASINGNTVALSDYGTLIMNAGGTWSFEAQTQAQKGAMLGLAEGENLIISVPVTGTDTHGATGAGTLTITVTGTNQAPEMVVIVENPTVIPTHEDAMLADGFSLKGSLSVHDPDGDACTYTLLGASAGDPNTVVGLYGILTVDPDDGSWTYVRFPDMDLNFMTQGRDHLDTFTVFVKDSLGAMAEKKLSFSIAGDNDAPVITGTTQGTIALDPLLGVTVDLTGRVLAFDVDEGDTVGRFDIVDGSLALDISGRRVELDKLGDVLDGLLDSADPLLNAVGTLLNDFLGGLGALLDGAAGLGDLLILDSDTGEWTLVAGPLNAVLNLLEGITDAVRNFPGLDPVLLDTLLVGLPWLDFKRDEDLLSLKVTVTAQDSHGASTETEITIGVLGGNNAPRFDVPEGTRDIGEDDLIAAHCISGTLIATDGENDPLTFAVADSGHGRYGTLTVSAGGTWTYTLTRDINFPAEGEVRFEEFTVMVSDGHGGRDEQIVRIQITGDNDAPVFELASLASIAMEDEITSRGAASGQLASTDPDSGAILTYSLKAGTGNGAYGAFSVGPTGEWTYTPTSGLAGLARGQLAVETCTVVVVDDHGAATEQTFTLTVVGTDDVPVVDTSGTLTTDETAMLAGGFSLSGGLHAHDPGDTYTYTLLGASAGTPGSATGLYGTLTLNPADGSWTYVRVPGLDLNFMAEGQSYVDAFSVLVRDAATGAMVEKKLSFSIAGDNDAPVLKGVLQDRGGLADPVNNVTDLTGRILAFDVDQGDTLAFSKSGPATLLLDGKPLVLSVTTILTTILTTISSSLTGPLLGGLVNSLVTPLLNNTIGPLLNAALNPVISLLGGAVIDLDEDTGQWTVLSSSLTPILNGLDGVVNAVLGTLMAALDANPLISSTVLNTIKNNLLHELPLLGFNRAGSALALDIPFHVQDNHGASDTSIIAVSILGGLNHAPAFAPATLTAAPVGEDALTGARFITGTLSASDQDAGDTLTYALVTGANGDWGAHGKYGSLTLDAAGGKWTYTLTRDISFMAQGESYVETFQVVVRDGRGGQDVQTLRIEITGENDAPVFDASTLNPLVTNEAFTDEGFASGRLSATDPDSGAVLTYSLKNGDGTGAHGALTVSPTGEWRYTPSAPLNRGQVETETFTVVVTDEHGAATEQTLALTLVGTNHAPEATVTAEASAVVTDEDAMLTEGFSLRGSLRLDDPEGNDPGTYTLLDVSGGPAGSVAGLYGILTLDPGTGNWTYARFPGMDLNFMTEGEKYADTFRVLVEDSLGATAEREIVFSITGRNDAPVITGISRGTIALDPLLGVTADLTGRVLAFDGDEGDTVSHYDIIDGTLVLDISGKRVELDKLGDVLDGLLDSADPLLNTVGKLLNSILGQVGKILDNTAGLGDLLILDSDTGRWTLAAAPLNAFLNLLEGVTDALRNIPGVDAILDPLLVGLPWLNFKRDEDLLSLKVTVAAQDNHGVPAQETEITIGILGGNNAPRFGAAEVTYDIGKADLNAAHFITGTLSATDGENAPLTFAPAAGGHGRYGTLTVLADGTWTYTLTKDVGGLAPGETYAETFTVLVSDGHGGQDEQTLRINIAGSDDVAAAGFQAFSSLAPHTAETVEGAEPPAARESAEPAAVTPETQTPLEQAGTGHLADSGLFQVSPQQHPAGDGTESDADRTVSREAGIPEPPAVMDTLNEEYGRLNSPLPDQAVGLEPQEGDLLHTLLYEADVAPLYRLPGGEHAEETLSAYSPLYQDYQGILEGGEGYGQDSELLHGLAAGDLAVELGLVVDYGADAVQGLSGGDTPPMDNEPVFRFMQNTAPEQDAELLALQMALQNG